ncbi:MAG: phage baseplate assembly protein V [Marinomonas foliarum]|uniref:phage baseplate assembly protein V n=1 Tax=Marinomonas foliarum TaxID=491950 RepID=UPI003F973C3E
MSTLNLLIRRIRRLAGRGLIRRVKYANKIRYFQVQQEGGMPLDDVEHLEPFGFTSHPLPNAETVVLAFNGNGSHSVAIVAGDQRYRLEIEEGEAAMYNNFGDKVHIKKDRTISVEAAVKVIIDTPHTHMTGKLTVAESIAAVGFITSDDYITAVKNIDAGTNITAVGVVKGASLTNTAGSASMARDGKMTVADVFADGVSLKTHVHSNGYNGGNTGGPQ